MEKDLQEIIDTIDKEVNNNTLSDIQMKEVQDYLKENEGPETKLMNEIKEAHKDEDNSSFELKDGEATIKINPETGLGVMIPEENKIETGVTMSDLDNEVFLDEVSDTAITNTLKNELNMSDEDVILFLRVIDRYKNKEKFDLYDSLPEAFKEKIREMIQVSKDQERLAKKNLNIAAKLFMDEIVSSAGIDEAFIDFDEAIKNELDIPSITDLYADFLKEQIEVDLAKKADDSEETNPEVAANIRNLISGFKQSYILTDMINILETPNSIRTRLYRDLNTYNKIISSFRRKVSKSKFKFYDIDEIVGILCRICETTEDTAKRLIILYCNTTKNIDIDTDIKNAAYMYYFVKNIKSLEFSGDSKSEFTKELIITLRSVLSMIDEFVKEKEIELKNLKGGHKNVKSSH